MSQQSLWSKVSRILCLSQERSTARQLGTAPTEHPLTETLPQAQTLGTQWVHTCKAQWSLWSETALPVLPTPCRQHCISARVKPTPLTSHRCKIDGCKHPKTCAAAGKKQALLHTKSSPPQLHTVATQSSAAYLTCCCRAMQRPAPQHGLDNPPTQPINTFACASQLNPESA